ncbi:MAG: hypothetical protein Q4E05_11010, partial [Pseudoclavibacter sp.]|nr:hypothetical protein [Pseudoclavibacter sp.]
RGILRFLTGPGNSRAPDTARPYRPELNRSFFAETVAFCLATTVFLAFAAALSQGLVPRLGMIVFFAAPCLWLSVWPLAGMLLRDWRRQATGGAPELLPLLLRPRRSTGLRALLPSLVIAFFGLLFTTFLCGVLFVDGIDAFR